MNRRVLMGVALLLLAARLALAAEHVALIKIDGAIGPATASYIARGIDEASAQGAQCLIIQLDTPGGLLDSTKTIVQKFYSSPIPTVIYVAPPGATATSAGCFITLAADIAAMAPATTIGAAHPVQIGGGGTGDQKPDDTMKEKLENYAVSFVESIAVRRNRNVDWARSAVKQSASISAEKALELKVIDLIAINSTELLSKLDGRVVNGRTLKTAGAQIVPIEMSARESIFQTLWRPEVMFILMLVAVYGIIGELNNPGAILPGVVGAIALVLALYMAAILPVNAAGLALIGLAFVLFIIDVFAPTHGVLTIGGIVSFFIGALMLFDRGDPAFRLSLAYIIPAVILTALFFFFVVGKGLSAQRLPVKVGKEILLGMTTRAVTGIDRHGGKVFIEGEYWNAQSDTPVAEGQLVQVTGITGLTLIVTHKTSNPA
jgi:membrane-bound serine protease (ClpP class)